MLCLRPSSSSAARENCFKADLVAYYDAKTRSIIDRYGPGPRVHYHTGLADNPPSPAASSGDLSKLCSLRRSDCSVMPPASGMPRQRSAAKCSMLAAVSAEVRSFAAQGFGAKVTAVTCVPSHIKWIAGFAAQAGVGLQIQPLLCDAHEVPGGNRFDAAVAVDSSGYLLRDLWLARMAALLRPGGRVFIVDCFLGHPRYESPFNSYWHTRIGTITEYVAAAHAEGLSLDSIDDISPRTAEFWATTIALMEAEARERHSTMKEGGRRTLQFRPTNSYAGGWRMKACAML